MKIFIIILFLLTLAIILFFIQKIMVKNGKKKYIKKFIQNSSIESIDALKGYDFEIFLCALFSSFGFSAKTTPKSGDKGADIIAKDGNCSIAIQAKLYFKSKVGSSAVQEIFTSKEYYNCNYSIVITNSYFSNQAIEMANKLGVILINRNDLIKLIKKDGKLYLLNTLNQLNNHNR